MHEDEPTTGQVTSDGDQQQTVKADETGGGLLAPGERVDRYVVRERLGEGGFAEVYLAEQEEPLRRRVALKIIKLGMDTKQVIARFEAERQALAMMDHPNVAKVFDAGSTESGRSYFVMEYVAGEPITDYCNRHKVPTRQRLELFIQACDAVQHAHQKGIIHRDIKPSNILVAVNEGKPVVKVIDLGIAKAISHRLTERTVFTEQGQLIGTPEYMSPEQAEMGALDIDTRTDIYSLGVLLYELLVGVLPFDPKALRQAGLSAIQRMIREDEPLRPSTRLSTLGERSDDIARQRQTDPNALRRELRGDLDWITMKALEKDRIRRYVTASALAEDIVRHFNDEPVTAGRPSPAYRLKKFLKRHRGNVLASAGLLLAVIAAINIGLAAVLAIMVVIVVGLTVSMWMYRVAESARREAVLARDEAEAARRDEAEQRRLSEKAREEAERQAEITRSINEYLEQILAAPVPWAAHTGGVVARDVKIVDVLDAASVKIDETLTEHPEVEAAVRATLGQAYFDLGYTERGATHLTRAFEIRRRVLGEEHPDTLKSMRQVGWVYSNENSIDAAVSMFSKAWELSLRVLGEEHPETLDSMSELAIQRHIQGRYDEAQSLFEKVLEVRHRTLGDEHPRTLLAMSNLLELYENQGRLEEAETLGAKALEIMQRVPGTEPMLTSSVMSTLAHVYAAEERWEEAEVLATEALETHRRIQGEEHPDTLMFMSDAGRLYIDRGLFDKAEPLVAGAVAGANESLPKGHRWTGVCLLHLGRCLTGLKRYREAEDALQEGYRILELAVGPENVRVTRAVSALGDLYDAWDKPEKAAEWRAKLATAQEAVASDQPGQRSSDEK